MSNKALVLSSGGLDSTVCVGLAVKKLGPQNVATVSISYGQKHIKELECANRVAKYYGVGHYELDLSNILQYSNCSLLKNSTETIPEKSYAEQIEENGEGKVSTYVPFRNGLMLSSVAALAQSIWPDDKVSIYIGAHADDASGEAYADCSEKFMHHMNSAIFEGTYKQVYIERPLIRMNKSEVVYKGLMIGTPFELTWSCYKGGDRACGKCGTCVDRLSAFLANNVTDPIEYEE